MVDHGGSGTDMLPLRNPRNLAAFTADTVGESNQMLIDSRGERCPWKTTINQESRVNGSTPGYD